MKPISFDVPGRAVPQPRTRSTARGFHYTPDNGVKGYKAHVAMLARRAGCCPKKGPVTIELRFEFRRPKSHFTAKGLLRSGAPEFPGHGHGDTDNLTKAVKDALTGIAYCDDTQVCEEHIFKAWGPDDRTLIRLS